jgi:hypothetical protein
VLQPEKIEHAISVTFFITFVFLAGFYLNQPIVQQNAAKIFSILKVTLNSILIQSWVAQR